jgi:hypothetical protein
MEIEHRETSMHRTIQLGATFALALVAGLVVTVGLALRAVDADREPDDVLDGDPNAEGVDDDGYDEDYEGSDDWWAQLVA